MKITSRRALGAGGVLLALALTAGCGSSTPTPAATSPMSSSMHEEHGVEMHDAWVKAADGEMTGSFGMLHNHGDKDVTVVSGSSSVAGMVELHEVAMVDGTMKMRPKEGGFVLKAGGSYELAPGHDHVMLMGLKEPLKSGTSVEITLKLSDGTSVTYTAPVKTFEAGNETYQPGSTESMTHDH